MANCVMAVGRKFGALVCKGSGSNYDACPTASKVVDHITPQGEGCMVNNESVWQLAQR